MLVLQDVELSPAPLKDPRAGKGELVQRTHSGEIQGTLQLLPVPIN